MNTNSNSNSNSNDIPVSIEKWRLAQMYFPNISIDSARNKLVVMMKNNRELMHELESTTGYRKCSKELSRSHLLIIFRYFGNPGLQLGKD